MRNKENKGKWLKSINDVRKISSNVRRGEQRQIDKEGRVLCEKIKQRMKGLLFTCRQERRPCFYVPGDLSHLHLLPWRRHKQLLAAKLGQNERSLQSCAALLQLCCWFPVLLNHFTAELTFLNECTWATRMGTPERRAVRAHEHTTLHFRLGSLASSPTVSGEDKSGVLVLYTLNIRYYH